MVINSCTNLNIFHIFKNVSTVIANRLVPLAVQAMLLVAQSTNLMVPCGAQNVLLYNVNEVFKKRRRVYSQKEQNRKTHLQPLPFLLKPAQKFHLLKDSKNTCSRIGHNHWFNRWNRTDTKGHQNIQINYALTLIWMHAILHCYNRD